MKDDNESRMDQNLSDDGRRLDALERWLSDPYNQEIAENIVWGWSELKHSFESTFFDCEIEDEMSISEVRDRFSVRRDR